MNKARTPPARGSRCLVLIARRCGRYRNPGNDAGVTIVPLHLDRVSVHGLDRAGRCSLTDLLGEIGETICWAIEDQAWSGFVIAVEDDSLTLSAGSTAGLAPGDEFDVYDTSRVLKGLSGQRFFVRGQKIGEIKITEVEADKARAVIVTNRGIKPGSSVRVK